MCESRVSPNIFHSIIGYTVMSLIFSYRLQRFLQYKTGLGEPYPEWVGHACKQAWRDQVKGVCGHVG